MANGVRGGGPGTLKHLTIQHDKQKDSKEIRSNTNKISSWQKESKRCAPTTITDPTKITRQRRQETIEEIGCISRRPVTEASGTHFRYRPAHLLVLPVRDGNLVQKLAPSDRQHPRLFLEHHSTAREGACDG